MCYILTKKNYLIFLLAFFIEESVETLILFFVNQRYPPHATT